MYRRYPHWLRLLLISCLLLGMGQVAVSAVPTLLDDCQRHCLHSDMSADQMQSMQQHDPNNSCCDDMQACGHCAHCTLIPLPAGLTALSFVSTSRAPVSDSPADPLGYIPPLHEHPPRS